MRNAFLLPPLSFTLPVKGALSISEASGHAQRRPAQPTPLGYRFGFFSNNMPTRGLRLQLRLPVLLLLR